MKERYLRNIGAISVEEQGRLTVKKVLIVGAGGLGGNSAMYLARLGVGELRLCDYDVFTESNLNRQLFCSEVTIGMKKIDVAAQTIQRINSAVHTVLIDEKLDENNAIGIVKGADVVIDGLDNVEARLILEDACQQLKIPLVYGAVSGWVGQFMVIMPGKPRLESLYGDMATDDAPPVLPFTAAVVSGHQSAMALKLLLGKAVDTDRLFVLDLEDCTSQKLDF